LQKSPAAQSLCPMHDDPFASMAAHCPSFTPGTNPLQ
jgi:hypothetical protein